MKGAKEGSEGMKEVKKEKKQGRKHACGPWWRSLASSSRHIARHGVWAFAHA